MPTEAQTSAQLRQALEAVEVDMLAFPVRDAGRLSELVQKSANATADTRRLGFGLLGQTLVAAGRSAEALQLADQLESQGRFQHDEASEALALLIRSSALVDVDVPRSNLLANNARTAAHDIKDDYVRFWTALAIGQTARMLGQNTEALANLQEAYTLADSARSPYRRANALYQLSVLHRILKTPGKALEESRQAFADAKLAGSSFGMAKAKIAESAALELLLDSEGELAAMQEALAIASSAGSAVTQALVLTNLADIYLRRRNFQAVLDVSRQSLALEDVAHYPSLVATNKANMGFALFRMGQIAQGRRLADEALADYERTGANADVVELLGEYGQHLTDAGDYKGALALRDRQEKVLETMLTSARQWDLKELQRKFAAERDLDRIALHHREQQEQAWWLFALTSATSLVIVALLYRRVRITNRMLVRRNEELSFYSAHDPLTLLYNRRHFQKAIAHRPVPVDRRSSHAGRPAPALVLVDLDHFKAINDQYGHAAGDAVLTAMAQRLRDAVRETDMIVRWGGEEFLVFVPNAPGGVLDDVVRRILHAIAAEPVTIRNEKISVTASIGYSSMILPPHDSELSWEAVLDLVDWALYVAKQHGRNRAYGIVGFGAQDDTLSAAGADGDLRRVWHDDVVRARALDAEFAETQVASPDAVAC